MKIRLFAILFCAVVARVSCIHEFPVTDHSFDFAGEIIYDSEADQHRLTLTCNKNSSTDQFNIVFHVDGENVITLTDMDGVTHQGWFSETFANTDSRTYILSEAPVGKHLLEMAISTEGFCQSVEIPYEVIRQKYEIHAEVSTVGTKCSSLLMSLAKGDARYKYNVKVLIDGEIFTTEEIDFSMTPIYSVDLSENLRPYDHSVTLLVSDGLSEKEFIYHFSEPLRHPYIYLELIHDDSSGKHCAKIHSNPYAVRLDFNTSLELKGTSTVCTTEDIETSAIHYRTFTKSFKDNKSSSATNEKEPVPLIDRDSLFFRLDTSYEWTYEWTYHPGGGDGECVEPDWWTCDIERVYYHLTSEDLRIDIAAEQITGITMRVKNSIGKLTLNGKDSSSGTISIVL